MDTYEIGEVATWRNCTGPFAVLNGLDVTITSGLVMRDSQYGACQCYETDQLSPLDNKTLMGATSFSLRKKRPPSTGEQSILALFKPMPQRERVAA